jgi:hypothetical protein
MGVTGPEHRALEFGELRHLAGENAEEKPPPNSIVGTMIKRIPDISLVALDMTRSLRSVGWISHDFLPLILLIRNCFYEDLSVGDPAAMEAERYGGGRCTRATGSAVKAWAARTTKSVTPRVERVNKSHNVAVVLGSIRRNRHEDCPSRSGTGPVVRLDGARCQIVFVHQWPLGETTASLTSSTGVL